MKKIVAFLLTLAMIFSLCACGGGASQSQPAPEPTPEPTPEPSPEELLIAEGQKYYYCLDDTEFDKDKAVEAFTKAAELDSGLACYYLGNLVQRSEAEDRFEKALAYYEKAAELGCDLGLLGKGGLYVSGTGVDRDYEKAMALYQEALDKGCVEANVSIGSLYANGRGVDRDGWKALQYFTEGKNSAELGYRRSAIDWIGSLYRDGNVGIERDYAIAQKLYEEAAELGSSTALIALASMYANGNGLEKDYEKAWTLLEAAAKKGGLNALTYMGDFYAYGIGNTEKNEEKALALYLEAAGQGYIHAYYRLGWYYESEKKDYSEALKWYQKGADLGRADCMLRIGVLYEDGNGVSQSYETAREWFLRAYEAGEISATCWLGRQYFNGWGVEKSGAKAKEWFQKGADAGNGNAMYLMGDLYRDDEPLTKNLFTARTWYKKSAEAEYNQGMLNYGTFLYWGMGGARNELEAVKWYQKAAEQHNRAEWFATGSSSKNAAACYVEAYIYENALWVEQDLQKALKWYDDAWYYADYNAQQRGWDAPIKGLIEEHVQEMCDSGLVDASLVNSTMRYVRIEEVKAS